MADFLTRLAGRTLGIEPSLRPVIPPIFAAGPVTAAEYGPEVAPQEIPADNGERTIAPVPLLAASGHPLSATGIREPHTSSLPIVREVNTERLTTTGNHEPQTPLTPAFAESRAEPQALGAPIVREVNTERLTTTGNREPQVLGAPIVREVNTERLTTTGMRELAVHTSSARPERQVTGPQQPRQIVIAPRMQRDASPLIERTTLNRPQPLIQQDRLAAPLSGSRREPQPAPAPVIKVSIGRIDVRAVTPSMPTVPRKTVPVEPQPSLEEYLQARNRGKR